MIERDELMRLNDNLERLLALADQHGPSLMEIFTDLRSMLADALGFTVRDTTSGEE